MNEELQKQWGMDVADYGECAYLMWETPYTKNDVDQNAKTIDFFIKNPNLTPVRKLSAALPFDLERAKAGDVVEYFNGQYWSDCDIANIFNNGEIEVFIFNKATTVDIDDLRMKFPPKVKP